MLSEFQDICRSEKAEEAVQKHVSTLWGIKRQPISKRPSVAARKWEHQYPQTRHIKHKVGKPAQVIKCLCFVFLLASDIGLAFAYKLTNLFFSTLGAMIINCQYQGHTVLVQVQ